MKDRTFEVLLIEDDADLSAEILAYIKSNGFAASHATTAEDGLRLLKSETRVQIVITDIVLPRMSGLELLKRMEPSSATLPVKFIILTAYPSIDYAVMALRHQVVDFLQKPLLFDELRAALLKAKAAINYENTKNDVLKPDTLLFLDLAVALRDSRKLEAFEKLPEVSWALLLEATHAGIHEYSLDITSICAACSASLPTAIRHLADLERRGLISRHADSKDGRRINVVVTQKGKELVENVTTEWKRKVFRRQ